MARFAWAVETILEHEVGRKPDGGFHAHPLDPGGATHWGISLRWLRTLELAVGDLDGDGDIDADDIRRLTREQALALYERAFWRALRLDEVRAQAVATKVVDTAINVGLRRGARLLQESLVLLGWPLAIDGLVGPQTLGAANRAEPDRLLEVLRAVQAECYLDLVRREPAQRRVFLIGWLRRAAS